MKNVKIQPMPQFVATQSDDDGTDEIDIGQMLRTLWNGKWIVVITTLFFALLGFIYVSQIEPTYAAKARVIFDLQERNVANIEDVIVDRDYNNQSRLTNEIEVLRSTALIERVIEDLRLGNNPEFNPRLRPEQKTIFETYFSWLTPPPELIDLLENMGLKNAVEAEQDPELLARRERLTVIQNVLAGLTLTPIRNSTVIEISFVSSNPNTSARVTNAIAQQYIVEQLEGKLEATRSATEWLSARVLELQDQVESDENDVAEARRRLAEATGQTLQITQAQLAELSTALTQARAIELQANTQIRRLESALEGDGDVGSVPEFRNAPLISQFRAQESELMARAASLRNSVGANHPSVVRIQAQLSELRNRMRSEARQVVDAVRAESSAAAAQAEQLAQEVRQLEELALEQSADEIELRQLERQAQASRLLYENFLARLQETSQQESLQSADARIITPAEVPNGPRSAGKSAILAVSALLGVVVGIALVFLLQRLNNTFRGVPQAESETGQTVLASIPTMGRGMHRRDILTQFRKKPNSSVAESIRNLRTSILFSDVDNPPKVVMFTSSIPSEGKSTTSTLIALTSQQMGKSAILIDCDFRLPALSKILEFDEDKPGILSIMNGTAEFEDALSIEPDTGLHVLMARQTEAKTQMNPADVLASNKFRSLIESLKDRYDLIVLDTPPVLVVSDARIVAKLADAVVYSVRWDSTARGAVKEGLKDLQAIGAPVVGMVFTLVNEAKASKYSYEGYGYGYSRGSYNQYYVDT